jgi:hypothetical protein
MNDEVMTVEGAWALYDLEERDLWADLVADRGFLARRAYLQGEHRARQTCERRVQHIRYRQPNRTRERGA